jgi:drug/metabolite transporter (DMT)-like permease
VIALLGGLGAAACWAAATLCSSRSTKMIGTHSALAWVMIVGCAVSAPLAVRGGIPPSLGAPELGWLIVAGAGNVVGLLLVYGALRVGKVSIVAPITSTEGAIAAILAIATGEAICVASGVMLFVIAIGVALASVGPGGGSGDQRRATILAGGAALCFGAGIFAVGRLSEALPLIWAIIPARVLGVLAVALPLVATRRLRLTRAAVPLVIAAGLCEVAGIASFAAGARHSIAISAVLASQFAALAVLAAYLLFRERITRLQLTGVAAIGLGIAVLTALQA